MVTLKNERLTVDIHACGAQIRKATLDGRDMLWNGDPAWWSGVAPVLFPVCGGFLTEEYTCGGQTYRMPKHGFARFCDFEAETVASETATFLLRSNAETLRQYPFDFEFRITYRLDGAAVRVTYDVRNTDTKEMPFAVGSHEGYATPEGIEAYDVVFPETETLRACGLQGNLLTYETTTVFENGRVLPLLEKYFEVDALVFKDLKSRAATLRHRDSGREITVEFPGKDYFLIWHPHGAPFICLEPWTGIPTYFDQPQALETKEGMTRLAVGGTYTVSHTIDFGGAAV